MYGLTTSPMHRGLPTDRLVAEWQLDSPRVVATLSEVRQEPQEAPAAIELPAELAKWKQEDPAQLAKVQDRIRVEFSGWFARGYAATGVRIEKSGAAAYLLRPWSDF
jgi:predicted GNAT superfamily acetyltransferase